jgi:hypothetical protein
MKRDWTVIAVGLCFAAVATLLVLLSPPHRLPSCDAGSGGSIDGTGGAPCGGGLGAWTSEALAGVLIGGVLYILALAAVVVVGRRQPATRDATKVPERRRRALALRDREHSRESRCGYFNLGHVDRVGQRRSAPDANAGEPGCVGMPHAGPHAPEAGVPTTTRTLPR